MGLEDGVCIAYSRRKPKKRALPHAFRQYAAEQQLLDSTIQATRGEIYDTSGITLASTSVVWTIWADPSYSSILYTSQTAADGTVTKTLDPAMCAEVSRELTLRLLSGDGESLDAGGPC